MGVYDNFFELGGHSLLATQVVSRMRADFHINMPLSMVFEATTIAALARAVDLAQWMEPTKIAGTVTDTEEYEEIKL